MRGLRWTLPIRDVCAFVDTFHEHNKSIHGVRVTILVGHHSHKTLEAIKGVHAHGITLITLVPHITHKMYNP